MVSLAAVAVAAVAVMWCSVVQRGAAWCSVVKCGAVLDCSVGCSVLQCVAVCCSVLQRVVVYHSSLALWQCGRRWHQLHKTKTGKHTQSLPPHQKLVIYSL